MKNLPGFIRAEKNSKIRKAIIELNETYWQGEENHEYFKIYDDKYKLWMEFINNECKI